MIGSALKPLLIAALESALNRYLALDNRIEQLLIPLAGKVIAVHISGTDQTIYLCPCSSGIQILEDYANPPDASLSGSLSALGLMGLSASPMHALFKGEVRMDGDVQLARKMQRLFAKLDIDLRGRLARYLGADLAGRLTGAWDGSKRWSQQSLTTFRLNLEEFLQEESRDLPAKMEAEILFQQIDELRSDYDRLAARINRIAALSSQPGDSAV